MSEQRKLPCDFCEGDVTPDEMYENRDGFRLWTEWYPGKGLMCFYAQAEDGEEGCIDVYYDYCPMCGRKLREV